MPPFKCSMKKEKNISWIYFLDSFATPYDLIHPDNFVALFYEHSIFDFFFGEISWELKFCAIAVINKKSFSFMEMGCANIQHKLLLNTVNHQI